MELNQEHYLQILKDVKEANVEFFENCEKKFFDDIKKEVLSNSSSPEEENDDCLVKKCDNKLFSGRFDTLLMKNDIVANVAPAEGQHPHYVLTDWH